LGDNGTADPGTDREHGHVAIAATRTKTKLGPARCIGIVIYRDVEVETLGETLSERFISPTDVRCVVDRRLGRIDESRSGDTGGPHLMPVAQALDHRDDRVDDLLGPGGRGWHPVFHDDVATLGDESACDLGAADVDSDCMHER